MQLKDFLNANELEKFNELQLELLDAHNKKERILIQAEIDEILNTARSRYESLMSGNKEQASTYELIRATSPFVRIKGKKEHVLQ
ncbi:MAG: hypothetical protein ACQEXE_20580 [Bacillota bacterium]|uniref:Uncharacterized protein n=1 Tax=Cytobacillus oceanisediminis 2691 TaxID=1196031 RepID=A0A160MHS5_9BACI|nr:hypothetical protein [Cytobacillus oceanisediminis]AND43047.1 hypothetical protein A361_28155 [Cytobacillus oceanisediminis 2691]MCM3244572.1 hypothetical protein [Cytobacillus oceanisediminis]USK47565.1 hypothetical protein LIT27_28940 [Cytobacillus oceanisediminis]